MPSCVRVAVTILPLLAAYAGAQGTTALQPPPDQLQRAAVLFSQSNWKGALDAYSALAAAYPSHAMSRFRVGVSLMELGRLTEAEASLREGERLGILPGQAAFRLAQVLAEQGKRDAAVAELQRGVANGLVLAPSALESDVHLRSLNGHQKWADVMSAFDAVARPCLHDQRFREFDFWIGDWDVRPTGQPPTGPPSRNTVTLENNGCVVVEHWTGAGGSVGQSFNIFDRSIGLWRQTWVDNIGGQHDYRGSLEDGNMVFTGDTPMPNGRRGRVPTRLTFFHVSKDSVRQYSELSIDSGKTWRVGYDLMYVRRPAQQPAGPPGATPASPGGLSDADRAAIRALDSAFVRAWLADDTAGVLGLFSDEAVLMPPNSQPVAGLSGIRAYWWPRDGSRTRITGFGRVIAEIGGTRELAFVRGTSAITWTYMTDGKSTASSSRSADLRLMTRAASGEWRIVRQAWNQIP
jgi:uncharacterized protein (TIGR02246 family)